MLKTLVTFTLGHPGYTECLQSSVRRGFSFKSSVCVSFFCSSLDIRSMTHIQGHCLNVHRTVSLCLQTVAVKLRDTVWTNCTPYVVVFGLRTLS